MPHHGHLLGRTVGAVEAITTRIGHATLPLGLLPIAISEVYHASREDPVGFPAVFEGYTRSVVWTSVHLGECFGFLLLLGLGSAVR